MCLIGLIMRKSVLFAVWYLLIVSLVHAESNLDEAQQVVRVGFIAPLTGELANYGRDSRRAAELAISDLNAEGLLGNTKIALVVEDGRCQGKQAVTATSKLIGIDKVDAIISAGCSSEVLAAAPIVERSKVILLSTIAESAAISDAGDFVFRISTNVAEGGRDLAKWVSSEGHHSVGIISENSDYALSLAAMFVGQLDELEGVVVANSNYNPDETDFRSIIQGMRHQNPDALLLNPQTGIKAGLLIKQIREMNWNIPIYSNYSISVSNTEEAAGGVTKLEGVKYIDYPVVASQAGKSLIDRFAKLYGKPDSDFNVVANYDGVRMLATAIKAVGYSAVKMKDYFHRMPAYKGVGFAYEFDEHGDATGVHYSRNIVENGQRKALTK